MEQDNELDWNDVYYNEQRETLVVPFSEPMKVSENEKAFGVELTTGPLVTALTE